jgi:hypothetical protein
MLNKNKIASETNPKRSFSSSDINNRNYSFSKDKDNNRNISEYVWNTEEEFYKSRRQMIERLEEKIERGDLKIKSLNSLGTDLEFELVEKEKKIEMITKEKQELLKRIAVLEKQLKDKNLGINKKKINFVLDAKLQNKLLIEQIKMLENKIRKQNEKTYFTQFEKESEEEKLKQIEKWKYTNEVLRNCFLGDINDLKMQIIEEKQNFLKMIKTLDIDMKQEYKKVETIYQNYIKKKENTTIKLKSENTELKKRILNIKEALKINV